MSEEELKEFNDIQLSAFLTKKEILKAYRNLQQENEQLKENNLSYQEEMCRNWEKVDKYKSVLDEIREYCNLYTRLSAKDLLQILDKVKE